MKSKTKQSKREIEAALFSADLDWDSAKNGQDIVNVFAPTSPMSLLETDPKSGNKPITNRQQNGNKVGTEPATKWQQTDNKALERTSSKKETGNKVGTEPATLSATKWQQTDNKPATKVPFSALVGLQRAILIFLYEACKSARGRSTESLTLEHIGSCLKTSAGSVKTTLQRLEDKNCIARIEFKNGRGGWSKYELPETLFREMLQLETENKLATKWQQTDNKVGTQPATEPATSPSSSSSLMYLEEIKTTTTEAEQNSSTIAPTELPQEWQLLDLSPLGEIGFTETHLIQIARQELLKPEVVQDSIYAFAFDLRENGKGRSLSGSPLNFFMGILRKGIPYAPSENYKTPEQQAIEQYLNIKKAQKAEQEKMERELIEIEFSEWLGALSPEDKVSLAPQGKGDGPLQRGILRNHFECEVWPMKRASLLQNKILINPDLSLTSHGSN